MKKPTEIKISFNIETDDWDFADNQSSINFKIKEFEADVKYYLKEHLFVNPLDLKTEVISKK